jgi:hypothetical protein
MAVLALTASGSVIRQSIKELSSRLPGGGNVKTLDWGMVPHDPPPPYPGTPRWAKVFGTIALVVMLLFLLALLTRGAHHG